MSVDEAFSRILESGMLAPKSSKAAAPVPHRRKKSEAKVLNGLDWAKINPRQYFDHPPLEECAEVVQGYNILRQRLQNLGLPRKSVLFTSCERGEGKTTAAIHLAQAMANYARQQQPGQRRDSSDLSRENHGRILLLDLDFRYPTVAMTLGIEAEYDFIDILQARCATEEAITYSESDNLYAMTARAHPQEDINLLRTDQTEELLRQLHTAFDFIVIDSPSCLEAPDAITAGSFCGGVILMVQERKTRREKVANALQMMQDYNTTVAGIVLNFSKDLAP